MQSKTTNISHFFAFFFIFNRWFKNPSHPVYFDVQDSRVSCLSLFCFNNM